MARTLEEKRVQRRAEYWKDPEKARNYQRTYRAENREEKLAASRAYAQGYRERNKEKIREYRAQNKHLHKKWREEHPKQQRLINIRRRCKVKGLPFNLTIEDLAGDFCPVLGLKLDWNMRGKSDASAEVDRIVPALGYVRGNVRVISARANRIKLDASLYELERVVSYVREGLGCP